MAFSKPPDELLDKLATLAGCAYLSDLCSPSLWPKLIQELNDLSANDYPLGEWSEAVAYLIRETPSFSTPEQARAYLLNRLRLMQSPAK